VGATTDRVVLPLIVATLGPSAHAVSLRNFRAGDCLLSVHRPLAALPLGWVVYWRGTHPSVALVMLLIALQRSLDTVVCHKPHLSV
jgi:hypothetical protein